MAQQKYFDQQISKLPGGSSIDSFKQKYLDPYNVVGDPGDLMNLGGTGYQTAADAAKNAQAQANALSSLQWQRQMQGLQGAQGYVNNLQSLYDSIYGPGGGQAAPGGQTPSGPTPAAMMSLSGPPPTAAPPAAAPNSGPSATSVRNSISKYDPMINTYDAVKQGAKGVYNAAKGLF